MCVEDHGVCVEDHGVCVEDHGAVQGRRRSEGRVLQGEPESLSLVGIPIVPCRYSYSPSSVILESLVGIPVVPRR